MNTVTNAPLLDSVRRSPFLCSDNVSLTICKTRRVLSEEARQHVAGRAGVEGAPGLLDRVRGLRDALDLGQHRPWSNQIKTLLLDTSEVSKM